MQLEHLLRGEVVHGRSQPLPVNYLAEQRELNQRYIARTRVKHAMETAMDVADGLEELDRYVGSKRDASPAAMAQMRGIQQIVGYGLGALLRDQIDGRPL